MATRTDAEAMGVGFNQTSGSINQAPAEKYAIKDQYVSSNPTTEEPENDTLNILRKMPSNVSVTDRIVVLGEPVQLNEDGFVESRGGKVVSFKNRYFPNVDNNTYLDAKIIYSMVFNNPDEVLLPPADQYQLELFLKGLINRRKTLYKEMDDEIKTRNDSATLRKSMEIYTSIDNLIKKLNTHIKNGNFHDYTPSGKQKGVVSVDIDKNIDTLLRQFAFLALQAKLEVPKYSDSTDNAYKMIEMLTQNPITKSEMNSYLKLWREQANALGDDIPFGVAEVLDKVSGQKGLIDTLVTKQIDSMFIELIANIKNEYSVDKKLSDSFNTYVAQLKRNTSDTKSRITQLLRWIVTFNKDSWDNLGKAQTNQKTAMAEYASARKDMQSMGNELDDAHSKYNELEEKYKKKTHQYSKGLNSLNELQDEYENYKKAHSRLMETAQSHAKTRASMEACKEKVGSLQEEVRQLEAIAAAAKAANSSANTVIGGYKNEIRALKKENERLQKMLPTLAEGVQNIYKEHTTNQEKLATAQTNIVHLKQSLQAMQGRVGIQYQQGGAALTVQEEQIQLLTKQLATAEQNYQQQIAAMTTTLEHLQEALDQHTNCQDRLKNTQTSLETTVRNTSDKSQQSSYDVKSMEVQIQTLSANLNVAKQELASKEESLNATKDTIRSLQSTLTEFSETDPSRVDIAKLKKKLNDSNETLDDLINNMKVMGDNIISNKEYVIPEGIAPKAGPAFKKLYEIVKTRIGIVKPGMNVACFLNYFVTFFLKIIFFSNPDKRHVVVLNYYRILMRDVVADIVTKIPTATKRQTLYTAMEFIFSLIHDCEVVKLTAEDVGLHVIMTSPDSNPIAVLESIYDVFSAQDPDALQTSVDFLKKGIFNTAALSLPTVHFNMPIAIKTNDDKYLTALTIFPNFTYIPDGFIPNTAIFDIIDTRNKYARQTVQVTDKHLSKQISKTMKDKTIDYISLFVMFILLAQEYLVEIEDDLKNCS